MASSNKQSKPDSKTVQRSEELVDRFLDAIWMERGLSKNTLGAYRADLMTLGRGLAETSKSIEQAEKADLLDFIAKRVESGAKPRSTARQLSSFRRFFRYIMREGMRDSDPTAEIEMPRIGRSLPKTVPGLRGFYMTGQWVEPGGGLPKVVLSARNVTQLVCRDDGRRFRTTRCPGCAPAGRSTR